MAGVANPAPPTSAEDRGRTALAILAAWLLPGLGHVVLGRVRRGIAFSVLILGSYGLGLAHDGQLALHDPQKPFLTSMQVLANIGVGPLDVVARSVRYGEPAYSVRGPRQRVRTMREKIRSPVANFGTAYLWTAGLMNLLLLFDVWDIARGRRG